MEPITIPTYVDLELAKKSLLENQFEQTCAGVRLWKLLDDLERYKRIIELTKPNVVVETGTAWGGSALWFAAQGLDVVTVDNNPRRSIQARELAQKEEVLGQVSWLIGRSVSHTVRRQVWELVKNRRTMVSLDSDHSLLNVRAEIKSFEWMVTPGCYMVVEDGIYELLGPGWERWGGPLYRDGGPLRAIQLNLEKNSAWTRDTDVERLSDLTHSPAGWWRKNG